MGGFQLFQRPDQPLQPINRQGDHVMRGPGRFVRILTFDDVPQLETIMPFTTEEELKDRGKSDGISKFIVLLQTSWFIIQCIARGIERLPLTELEIVTLAYAMMNLFVYIFWWDKPRDVGCPIRVYESLTMGHREVELWATDSFRIVEMIFVYALGTQDQYLVLSQESKVPMFWSGGIENNGSGDMVSMGAALGPSILGIAFGALHCIAWSYVFPSYTELVLWHTSCIAMMVVPLLSTVACTLVATKQHGNRPFYILAACFILLALSAWLYIAARSATIVIAFTTLRSLPSEAFKVVDWTTFIPHI